MAYKRIGDLLQGMGLITQEQVEQALKQQKVSKKRLGQILIDMGFLTEQQMIEALEVQLGISYIDLTRYVIPVELAQVLPKNIARKNGVVPVRLERDMLYLAMSDPLNFPAIEEVKAATKKRVIPMVSTASGRGTRHDHPVRQRGRRPRYGGKKREAVRARAGARSPGDALDDETHSAPTVRFVNSVIARAVHERASDIHLEPYAEELRVRMRIDGVMRNMMTVPKELQASVLSRLKVMGGMDIAERRVPQDGRANVQVKQKDIDLRMSTLPTIYGEKLVIRVLDKDGTLFNKKALGLSGEELEKYDRLLSMGLGRCADRRSYGSRKILDDVRRSGN